MSEVEPSRPGVTTGFLAVHVVSPIVLGGLMYLLWRDTSLLMFRWADAVGLAGVVEWMRTTGGHLGVHVPEWVLFSLPDGCWVYSCTAFFARLWRDETSMVRWFWVGIGPALAIGGELGQLVPGFVPGTFDLVDMIAYFLATAIAFFFGWVGLGSSRSTRAEELE